MLTDIFAHRYVDRPIWAAYTELEKRLLNQAFGIVKDALPYYDSNGKEIEANKTKWKTLHDRIASYLSGTTHTHRKTILVKKSRSLVGSLGITSVASS